MYTMHDVETMCERLESLVDWCSDFGYSAEEIEAEALVSELSYYSLYANILEMDCSDYMEDAERLFAWAEDHDYTES